MTFSLGLINLLEWLTELRETFYLLCYQSTVKGYNLGTAGWKKAQGKVWGKARGLLCHLLEHNSPHTPQAHQPRSSPNPFLLGSYRGFITYALLIKLLTIDN